MPIVIDDGEYTDRPYYSDINDVKMIFGDVNATEWADLDNQGGAEFIAQRFAWANAQAYAFINSRLQGGVYAIPFVEPYPLEIVDLSARWAGVLLYESRGIADVGEELNHVLQNHKKRVETDLSRIRAGILRLDATQINSSHPASLRNADLESEYGANNSTDETSF